MRLCLGNPPDSVAMFWRPKLAAPQWPFSCSHQLTCAAMRPAGQHSLLQYGAIGAIWLLVWNIANWVSSNYLPTDLVWWTLFLHHWKQLFQVFWCGGDAIYGYSFLSHCWSEPQRCSLTWRKVLWAGTSLCQPFASASAKVHPESFQCIGVCVHWMTVVNGDWICVTSFSYALEYTKKLHEQMNQPVL